MENKSCRILTAGSINIDLVAHCQRIPNPGETLSGTTFSSHHGGKGANQCMAACRAGASTDMLGAVGDDVFGSNALENLENAGVSTTLCSILPEETTGTALITIDASGENSIVVVPGANARIAPKAFDSIDWKVYDALLLQLEIPFESVTAAIQKAASRTRIILTPAPARPIPQSVIQGVDILIPNQHEICLLGYGESPFPAAKRIAQHVGEGVLLTMGSEGAFWIGKNGDEFRIPAVQTQAVDTVGAGDCFTGYFAEGLCSGLSVKSAIERACRAAAIQITRSGAQESIPSSAEINAPLPNIQNSKKPDEEK